MRCWEPGMVVHGLGIPNMGLLLLPIHHISFTHSSDNLKELLYITPHRKRSSGSLTVPNLALSAETRTHDEFWFSSSSHLRVGVRNGHLLLSSPLHAAATLQISQSLISLKPSDSSTLRTSTRNPNSGGANEPDEPPPPEKSPNKVRSPLVVFQALKPADLKESLQSTKKRKLKHYTLLAGQLAGEGHMLEFIKFLQMLADAGLDREVFTSKLDSSQLDAGFTLILSRKQLDLFLNVMKKLTKAGYTAWEFVGKGPREVLSVELLLLLEEERIEQCVKIIESLSECGFLVKKLIDPALVIASCAKARNFAFAHRFVKLLSRNPWHYNLIIREFSYHHELQSSFAVLGIMKDLGVAPDLYTYRALIDSCGRCNEPSKAGVVFETMVKDGIKPNIFVYNSMMNVNVGDLDEVQRYYQHMEGAGITGDLASFNILLKAYAASGRADLAADLYFHIQQAGEPRLDVVSYSTLINVFGRAKMWEEALRIKADMLESGVAPNVVTWTSIIGACANAGLVEQSFREFDEMLSAGCRPNVNCYNMLLQACIMASQVQRAFQLFQEWKQTGRIRSFSELVNHHDPVTRTHELIAVTDIFPRPSPPRKKKGGLNTDMYCSMRSARCKPNQVTYNCMMKACGTAPEKIRSLMQEMKTMNLLPDVKSYSILVDAYGSKGDLEGALAALEEMQVSGFEPDVIVYTALIKACVQSSQVDKAFEIFREMKAAGLRPNAVTYNTLLRGHRSHGEFYQVQRALAVYEEMRKAGHVPNDFILQGLITEWAEGISTSPSLSSSTDPVGSSVLPDRGFLEYTEALVHKVAVHALGASDDLTIDLHGLSKGEARTAVLAVLRIIKERYLQGRPIQEDLIIITGMGNRSEKKGVPVIRDVVLDVLQKELSLRVVSVLSDLPEQSVANVQLAGNGSGDVLKDVACDASSSSSSSDGMQASLAVSELVEIRPRRPVNSGRLKVTKESLNAWLGRKAAQPATDQQSFSF